MNKIHGRVKYDVYAGMKIKTPSRLHALLHCVDATMCNFKRKRPVIFKKQSNISSKVAAWMPRYTNGRAIWSKYPIRFKSYENFTIWSQQKTHIHQKESLFDWPVVRECMYAKSDKIYHVTQEIWTFSITGNGRTDVLTKFLLGISIIEKVDNKARRIFAYSK